MKDETDYWHDEFEKLHAETERDRARIITLEAENAQLTKDATEEITRLEDDYATLKATHEELGADKERLDWLITNAFYLGEKNEGLKKCTVALVIGDKVEWPEGIRAAIDKARGASLTPPSTPSTLPNK